jgi:hypothetical protein
MATVVGKTSTRIDQLLADLFINAAVIDGNLIFTQHDGGQINIGNVGGVNSVQRIHYTNGAWPARPVGALNVQWIGPTFPSAMTERDDWLIVP